MITMNSVCLSKVGILIRIAAFFLGTFASPLSHAAFGYCSYSAEDDHYFYHSYLTAVSFFVLIWAYTKGPLKNFREDNVGIAVLIFLVAPFIISILFDDGSCNQVTGNPY